MEHTAPAPMPASVDALQATLQKELYVADRALAMSIYLALRLRRPLFLEGEAGVGKTEVARALASALGARLIRLQCYEGLDVTQAVYEWNYSRQLLHIRLLEAAGGVERRDAERELFSEEFLIKRPLLQALEGSGPTVLLIDELDRADEEFEGYLLEMLADFQITVPEVGTYTAEEPPIVMITSNRTREIHDALKRRCLYYWIDYPDLQKEMQIVRSKVPEADRKLAEQVTAFVQELRGTELYKVPGVAETLDWTAALVSLNERELSPSVIDDTLGVMLKYREDVQAVRGEQTRAILNRALHRGTRRGGPAWLAAKPATSSTTSCSSAASCGASASTSTQGGCSTQFACWKRSASRAARTCGRRCARCWCTAGKTFPSSTRPSTSSGVSGRTACLRLTCARWASSAATAGSRRGRHRRGSRRTTRPRRTRIPKRATTGST